MSSAAQPPSLARIVTIARAGSLAHAEALFESLLGTDKQGSALNDPAVLAVGGRLAKDRAARAPAGERPSCYAAAAVAYGAAHALAPQPYTLINQATLTWLAGDRGAAQVLARQLLAWLDRGDHPEETPYWVAATRAEAHLLLGEQDAAEQWLGRAIALNPAGLEDRAATLRQLRLILTEAGADASWLEPFRPGRVLHFAGHLGIAESAAAGLTQRVSALLDAHGVVAGHGALAAGADLVVAEAVLARGAELHVVLPVPPAIFAAQSVVPFGMGWEARFADVCAAAASLRWVTSFSGDYQPLATALAADVAMGAARVQAARLETSAVQVLVVDGNGYGQGLGTAYQGRTWQASAAAAPTTETAQICLIEPRSAAVAASGAKSPEGRPDLRLVSLLHFSFAGCADLDDAACARALDEVVLPMERRIARLEPAPDLIMTTANGWVAAFPAPEAAWKFAAQALALADPGACLRVVAHHGVAHVVAGPAGSGDRVAGNLLTQVLDLAAAALPGVTVATETFVAALGLRCPDDCHVEEIGAWHDAPLFSVQPRRADQ